MNKKVEKLDATAVRMGASKVGIISASEIIVEDKLAKLCNGDPTCDNYGLSMSCPPHVPGPQKFREWQKQSSFAIVIRIDVPSSVMFSDDRREVMQLLHEIVAVVEQEAVQMGYTQSRAFAGGSCKNLFCADQHVCRVISEKGDCRNPTSARPSMSGFGINVTEMMRSAGWPLKPASPNEADDSESMTWVAGLVLISESI
jgi:predicted metal-binding protein